MMLWNVRNSEFSMVFHRIVSLFFISSPKAGSTSLTPWLLYFCMIQCILCPVLYHFCWSFLSQTFCKYLSITLHSTQPISQRTNQAYFSWLMLTGSNVMKRKSYTTWFEVHFLLKFYVPERLTTKQINKNNRNWINNRIETLY